LRVTPVNISDPAPDSNLLPEKRAAGNVRISHYARLFPWYLVIILLLLSTGCNHTEGTLKIKGKVIDEFTRENIPLRDIIVDGLTGPEYDLVPVEAGFFTADSTGCFDFTLKKVKNAYTYNFKIVGDSDYAFKANHIPLGYLQRRPGEVIITASKLTALTIKINRKSTTLQNDTLYLFWSSDGIEGKELYPSRIENYGSNSGSIGQAEEPDFKWIGGFVNAAIKTRVYSEKPTIIKWALNRDRRREEIIDTIICRRGRANTVYFTY